MFLFLYFFFFLVLISIPISDRRLISCLTLFVLASSLDMFIYSYDCACESLSTLLATRSRSENRSGSGVFVLTSSFISFYLSWGLGCDGGGGRRVKKNWQSAWKGGNGSDLSLFMIFRAQMPIAWSRTLHIHIRFNRKYEEKNQINHFAQQLPCAMVSA